MEKLPNSDGLSDTMCLISEDDTQNVQMMETAEATSNDSQRQKRDRQDDEEGTWEEVKRNPKKRIRSINEDRQVLQRELPVHNQVSVVCQDAFPKQFGLAKLLKHYNITGILRVKYINPFKLIINFSDESCVENFISNQHLTELGWKRQNTMQVGESYGMVKNIDLDLTEEELLAHTTSSIPITSAKRLNRRCPDGWTISESVRLGFKGSPPPQFVYLCDMRIKVDPYVFPVTQCSRCWRFGHSSKLCPSNKVICPKCGDKHSNCDTNRFKCANCSGKHMSLARECPVYIKEKRLRELMSEFGCSYQKALTIYVPPSPSHPQHVQEYVQEQTYNFTPLPSTSTSYPTQQSMSYSGVLRSSPQIQNKGSPNTSSKTKKKTKKKIPYHLTETVVGMIDGSTESEDSTENGPQSVGMIAEHGTNEQEEVKNTGFTELLRRLKEVIYIKKHNLKEKVKLVANLIKDWIITIAFNMLGELPLLKNILEIFSNG